MEPYALSIAIAAFLISTVVGNMTTEKFWGEFAVVIRLTQALSLAYAFILAGFMILKNS